MGDTKSSTAAGEHVRLSTILVPNRRDIGHGDVLRTVRRSAIAVLAGLLTIAAWCFFWPDGSLIGSILVSIWSWLTPTPWLHDHIGPRVVEQGMNAAVFVPLTACLVLAFPHIRIRVWWILSALCSCSIELFQLLFLPGRVFDPVDAVSNSIGGILGSILGLMLLRRILRARAPGDSRRAPALEGHLLREDVVDEPRATGFVPRANPVGPRICVRKVAESRACPEAGEDRIIEQHAKAREE